MKNWFPGIAVLFCVMDIHGQDKKEDSLFNGELDEVVVTATRSERLLSNVAVPTTIISQKNIRQSGSLRLNDILSEQTGLHIIQSFGRGVQMQGLSPDYTLILLDGEPLIGRTGGVLDLSRVTLGNIKKIEIVKGPSSSLYGSEALAGVINIITDRALGSRLTSSLRYGRFNTIDGSMSGALRLGKFNVNAFLNTNSSEGYSLQPNAIQKTVEPFWRLTNQLQLGYTVSKKTRLGASIRYNHESIQNSIAVQNAGNIIYSEGKEIHKDINVNPTLSHQFNDKLKTTFRGYASVFESNQQLDVKGQGDIYNDYFKQEFYRVENQTDITFNDALMFNVGGGVVQEYVRSNRYDSLSTRRNNSVGYFFVQGEWRPFTRLAIIPGIRFDDNEAYASQWSPKLAVQYKVNDRIRLNASYGKGFKAPDFRQLYLNFTNLAAGSYSVFGASVAADEVSRLQDEGQIDNILPAFYQLADLKPETSAGLNLGIQLYPTPKISARFNLFRNDIDNLILTDIIAYKTNGGQIYSYLNVNRALTQGIEADANWLLNNFFTLSAGYQFLVTADKDVLDNIEEGKVFKRDEHTGISSRLNRSEYVGLPNRSKHMANLKLFFESAKKKWFATTRVLYRGRWGTTDLDGNGIINRDDEFADAYAQVNISGGRNFNNGMSLMAGVDNLLNYKDPENLPGLPGYNWYLAFTYDFLKLRNSSNNKID